MAKSNNAAFGNDLCKAICKKNDNMGLRTEFAKAMCKTREKVAIGIDLGSSTCTVGVYQGGEVEIIINEGGNSPMPTPDVVGITDDGKVVPLGNPEQDVAAPKKAICDMMKTIGKGYYDKDTYHEMRMTPFRMINVEGLPALEALCKRTDRRFTPPEITSMILRRVKEISQCLLGKIVDDAVITVPVYFNEYERQTTIEAAKDAGLNVLRLLNEPVAAALAYGYLTAEERKHVLLFDFGGGTLDVSVFSVGYGVIDLKATSGNTRLGGKDIDSTLLSHFAKEIKKEHGLNIMKNRAAMEKVRSVSEEAKRCLSTHRKAVIKIKGLIDEVTFNSSLTRAKFEELNADIFNSTITAIEDVLVDANVHKEEISDIVLVGGSTKIPKIQSLIKEFFDGKELIQTINPIEAVAIGAALEAAARADEEAEKTPIEVDYDTAPHSLGIRTARGSMTVFVPKGTPLPCTVTHEFSTYTNNQQTVILQIFEGEKRLATDNEHLANLELTGLQRSPRGVPRIQVTFCVEKSGIIIVTARDEATHRKNAVMITKNFRKLSKLDMDQMLRKSVDSIRKLLITKASNVSKCLECTPRATKEDIESQHEDLEKRCEVHCLPCFVMKRSSTSATKTANSKSLTNPTKQSPSVSSIAVAKKL